MTPEERVTRAITPDPKHPYRIADDILHSDYEARLAAEIREAVLEERERWIALIRTHCPGRRCEGCEAVVDAAGGMG